VLLLHAGSERGALAVGALAMLAYYVVVARSPLPPGSPPLGADRAAESLP
jgi:hypothetical protein